MCFPSFLLLFGAGTKCHGDEGGNAAISSYIWGLSPVILNVFLVFLFVPTVTSCPSVTLCLRFYAVAIVSKSEQHLVSTLVKTSLW